MGTVDRLPILENTLGDANLVRVGVLWSRRIRIRSQLGSFYSGSRGPNRAKRPIFVGVNRI